MAKKIFSQAEQDAVWNKAFAQNNNDPNLFRKDFLANVNFRITA